MLKTVFPDGLEKSRRSLATFLLLLAFFFFTRTTVFAKDYGSIGASVVPTSVGHLVVLGVFEKSPAGAKGLLPGDLIIEVNGFDLTGSAFPQVAKKHLWGAAGTKVNLKILRPGKEGVISLDLVRAKLAENSEDVTGVKMIFPQ